MKVQFSQLVAFIVPQAISKDPFRFAGKVQTGLLNPPVPFAT